MKYWFLRVWLCCLDLKCLNAAVCSVAFHSAHVCLQLSQSGATILLEPRVCENYVTTFVHCVSPHCVPHPCWIDPPPVFTCLSSRWLVLAAIWKAHYLASQKAIDCFQNSQHPKPHQQTHAFTAFLLVVFPSPQVFYTKLLHFFSKHSLQYISWIRQMQHKIWHKE